MHRIRFAGTGAAPIAPDLIRWYRALGVDMREVYGQTENCGVATGMPDRIKLGTVGVTAPEHRARSSRPRARSCSRARTSSWATSTSRRRRPRPCATAGCTPATSASSTTRATCKITDRMKDIIITAGGKNITPSEIENQLKFSPYISDAVVIGDKRKFLSCLIMIDYDNVAEVRPGQQRAVHRLRLAVPRARGRRPDLGGDRAGERGLRPGRDDQEVPADRAAAHGRGRRGDPDHEAQAQVRERKVQGDDRRHVCRSSARSL